MPVTATAAGDCARTQVPRCTQVPGQILADAWRLRGDGEYREQTEADARRYRVDVDPERHPRQDDDHDARDVDLDHVEGEATRQQEVHRHTAPRTCTKK